MTTSGSVRLDHNRLHGFKLISGTMPGAKIGDNKGQKLGQAAVSRQLGAKIGQLKDTPAKKLAATLGAKVGVTK